MPMNNWWTYSIEDVAQTLKTNKEIGLTSKQASIRLKKYGRNELPTNARKSAYAILLEQFSNIFVWLLLGAAGISCLLGQHVDAIIITVIVTATIGITFIQEYKSETSIALLLDMTRPLTTVVRDSVKLRLPAHAVVPGDLVVVEAGDVVIADGRIIESFRMCVDESSLTGESTPIVKTSAPLENKNIVVGDRTNMLFRGTAVVSGKGSMIITQTGVKTEFGKIAHLLKQVNRRKTFFEARLDKLVKTITWLCCTVIFIAVIIGFVRGIAFYEMFFIALSLIVAAIPEVLPLATTLALVYGTKRMMQHNILMRRLSAVEALGRVSVICSDKTGTLTKNEKVVTTLWLYDRYIQVTGSGYNPIGTFKKEESAYNPEQDTVLMLAVTIGMLCNDTQLIQKNNRWMYDGDPSEAALLVVAQKAGLTKKDLIARYTKLLEIPFDPLARSMGIVCLEGGEKKLYIKGAPDKMIADTTFYMTESGIEPLTSESRAKIEQASKQLADQGLRVFATAFRVCKEEDNDTISLHNNFTFVGLLAMTDPLKEGVVQAIKDCAHAGITTVMITGDHSDTAIAIGKQLGLIQHGLRVITGSELDSMTDSQVQEIIHLVTICARSSVEHKVRIVQAWQALGHVVATTGDGTNDAPALKVADIGIAMGQSGTALAKEASDVILLDDNFASIVHAIKEGRGIFDSVRRNAGYIITTTIAELGVVCSGILFGLKDGSGKHIFVLLPIHLLWLDLMTEVLMTTALINDQIDPTIMDRKPKEFDEDLLPMQAILLPACIGSIVALCALVLCYMSAHTSGSTVRHLYTLMFTGMVIFELIALQLVRIYYNVGVVANSRIVIAFMTILLSQSIIMYTPMLANLFHVDPMTGHDWIVMSTIGFLIFGSGLICIKLVKYLFNKTT